MLDELALTESGIGFVYSALDLLAKQYQLSDAVLTIVSDSFGTQMFRLGGKGVSTDLAAKLGGQPGLYCESNLVSDKDRDALCQACQHSLSLNMVRFNTNSETLAHLPQPLNVDDAPVAIGRRVILQPSGLMISMAKELDNLGKRVTLFRARRSRATISMVLLVLDLATLAMTIGGLHGPVRFVLGLALGVAIPGWSIVGLLGLQNAALELGLTLAVSLSLIMVAAQIMMTVRLWHPLVLEEVTCLICLPSLIWQAQGFRRAELHPR